MKTRDDLLAVIEGQHDAIDTLFAMLIELTRKHTPKKPFFPSQSGDVWQAALAGADVMRTEAIFAARREQGRTLTFDDLRDALVRCGEQARDGMHHEHGDCPATFACGAIVGELCSLGMPPDGVEEVTA